MSPTAIIGETWDLYKRFFGHFASVGLTVYVVVAVIVLVLSFLGLFGLLLGQIVVIVGSILLTGALVTAVGDVRDGRVDLSVGETLSAAVPFLGALLVAGILAGIAIGIGLLFLIVPGVILATIWYVIAPAIVLERTGWSASFGRSMALVKGYFLPVLGVLVLTILIVIAAGIVIGLILSPLPDWLASFIATIVQGAVFAPFAAVAVTLTYYRLKELEGGA